MSYRITLTMVEYAQSLGVGAPDAQPFDALRPGPSRDESPPHGQQPASMASGSGASRNADLPGWQIAALFVLFAAIAAIPVMLYPLPPISDYVNHLSRMHIIASLGSDSNLARFYEVNWQIIPNLMMDMIVPNLVRVMNVYAAGQAYTIASFVLIMSGTFALNRQLHGRWSVLPLVAFPLLYNYIFLIGTMNYVFGIGLSLWALVTWIALRERHMALRLMVSSLFVIALFFCHLFALGTYSLGLLAFELDRLRLPACCGRTEAGNGPHLAARPLQGTLQRPLLVRRLIDFVATGLPFLPVLPLMMMSPTWGLRGDVSWEFDGKIDGVVYAFDVYSDAVALLLGSVVASAAAYALCRRALRFHVFGMVLLAIGAVVYLAMPRIIFDTYMADQRLPISLAFMVIACVRVDFDRLGLHRAVVRYGAIAVMFALLALRVSEVQSEWAALSPGIAQFRESIELIDRGAKVMVAYADPDGGDDVHDLGLVHAACLAVIERSALVTTVFTVIGKQVLHVRADFRDRVDTQDGSPPTVDTLLRVTDRDGANDDYWRRWTTDYDYLYVLFTDANYKNPDPARLTPLFAGERFMLYRIENAQIADARK
jgi:hypothetical protein